MTDLNHVVLIGRLTKDIGEKDFGYVGQNAKLTVNIAVNRSVKKGDEWTDQVSYFEAVIWGKTAENLKPYITKGKQVCIEGVLKQERWEKDGQKHSKVTIQASHVQLLGGRNNNTEEAGTFKPANKETPAQVQELADAVGGEVFPEDIPF